MARVQLIHWREEEGRERARELRAAGVRVEYERDGRATLRAARDEPPAAIVIDLTRMPSHGRELAWELRRNKKTRLVPLVFAGGEPAKVARIRKELPDATFAEWSDVARAIAGAGTRVWVASPKKGSSIASDLTVERVRTAPHAHGLVDYKICAIDDDWSGMCFALRKS